MDNNRWIEVEKLDIPEIKHKGFESRVLDRKVWNNKEQHLSLIRMDSGKHEVIEFGDGRETIGKSSKADHVIEGNQSISRIHAKIFKNGDEFFVEDCGSLNHTFIDEQMISGVSKLKDGAVLRLANESFAVRIK